VTSKNRVDCAFCAIGRGDDAAAEIVCTGALWVAFFPLEPATPGHTLIIPRDHVLDLWAAEPELAAELMCAAVAVGTAIQRVVRPEGMNLITSAGSAAEQTVFHLHLHVIPRWGRDGFGEIWPRGPRYEDEALLEGIADRIRSACAAV
jgi:histidine triad (HIT) family protein